MKRTFLTLLLFGTLLVHAADPFKYKLAENQKMEKTYSFDLKAAGSLHVIIAKNKDTKKYDLIPLLSVNGQVKTLQTLSFDEVPNLLSFHKNGNVVTLADFSDKTLNLTELNLETLTGKTQAVKDINEPINVLRQDDKTIFISKKKDDIVINEIRGIGSVKEVKVDKTDDKAYKELFSNNFEAVDRDEFVANGSISAYKCYTQGNNIIFTADDTKTANVKAMTVDLATGKAAYTTYAGNFEDAKNVTSYIADEKLFSIATNKDNLQLTTFNLNDEKPQGTFGMKDIKAAVGNSAAMQNYLGTANKGSMKPTLAVNGANDKFALRFDAVDRNAYRYQDNWWFMHQMQWQMQMQMQQMQLQQMQNMQRMRGPSPDLYDVLYELYYAKASNVSFTVMLDVDMKLSSAKDTETDYKEIDKEKMLKPLQANKNMENLSAIFTEGSMIYMYQNKNTKEIIIDAKEYAKPRPKPVKKK